MVYFVTFCFLLHPFIHYAVHCVWDDWKIGVCSVTCGEGVRNNTRTQKIAAQFGGDECDGATLSVENCIENTCPGIKIFHFCNLKYNCIVISEFGSKQRNIQ